MGSDNGINSGATEVKRRLHGRRTDVGRRSGEHIKCNDDGLVRSCVYSISTGINLRKVASSRGRDILRLGTNIISPFCKNYRKVPI